jgi:hypothetical protein
MGPVIGAGMTRLGSWYFSRNRIPGGETFFHIAG